jgi:hypothetical protein
MENYKAFNMESNITCTTNCKYREDATLYTLVTWFVSGVPLSIPYGVPVEIMA